MRTAGRANRGLSLSVGTNLERGAGTGPAAIYSAVQNRDRIVLSEVERGIDAEVAAGLQAEANH
ncbi:hypothetical protein ACGFMK_13230 [Amycolatopsis sp. NPDC049252]|uniref:hypothetical protein n=1 Tax=Amycolatopsis sp. NPDC049252 TaxID=3363933 RepID=UPI00371536B3